MAADRPQGTQAAADDLADGRCTAKAKSTGGRCGKPAIPGGTTCRIHGSAARQVRKAGERRVLEQRAAKALAGWNRTPVTDPVSELAGLAGEVLAWKEHMRGEVEQLDALTQTVIFGESGGSVQQVAALVEVYERALDRAAKVLTDMARLGIADRIASVNEQQGQLLAAVIRAVLGDLGLTPEQEALVGEVVPRRLREIGGGPS